MKKTIPFLLIIIVILTISLYYNNVKKSDYKTELISLKEENKEIKAEIEHYREQAGKIEALYGRVLLTNTYDITYREFKNKIGTEKFIIVITMQGCSHCESYLPRLDEILFEKNLKAYHLDIVDLSQNEFDQLIKETEITSTPTTLIYQGGTNQKSVLKGDKSADEILAFLKENGYE